MQLRILRNYEWKIIPYQEIRMGGGPPAKELVPVDTLQYLDEWFNVWKDVPIVEGVKPCPHCDNSGDVHGLDGEWKGRCVCERT